MKLIEQLHHLGARISYDRVIQIEKDAAYSLCVKPMTSHLRKGIFMVGAMDNIDHDQSSKTAQSSFRGTGVSHTGS